MSPSTSPSSAQEPRMPQPAYYLKLKLQSRISFIKLSQIFTQKQWNTWREKKIWSEFPSCFSAPSRILRTKRIQTYRIITDGFQRGFVLFWNVIALSQSRGEWHAQSKLLKREPRWVQRQTSRHHHQRFFRKSSSSQASEALTGCRCWEPKMCPW